MGNTDVASGSTHQLRTRLITGWVALMCLCSGMPGHAQGQEGEVDPPGRVGRLSEIVGQVLLFHPGAGEWANAKRNLPVTGGDRLATEPGARAELRIGSTTLRLDSSSELEVIRIDDTRMEFHLHAGTTSVRLRNREAVDEFELRTGEGRFRAQRTGRYRVDRIDEASHLTVTNGAMVYEGPGSALTVYSGQRAEFWLDSANAAQYSITEPKRDSFAAWNSERDRLDDRSAATRYVSPEMTGVEELDRHGRWETSDEYGSLWIPRGVAAGWAPYSTGNWVWVRPWGWTWVDDAPWGFAPFHYGRWVYYRSNWCWAPGTRVLRPVYAPALVAWIGGPRASVSVSIGGVPAVGWFPLAPREVYVPSYYVTPRYIREVNVTHVTQITNVTQIVNNGQGAVEQRDFSNRKFPHAVTVVPSSVMTLRQPVAPAAAQWRERNESRDLIREVTRGGTTLVAAPVEAPTARSRPVESQLITSPNLGGTVGPQVPTPRAGPRIGEERRGDQRRGDARPTMAIPAIPGQEIPQRPTMTVNPASPNPAVPHVPAAAVVPPAVISLPNRPQQNQNGNAAVAASPGNITAAPAAAVAPRPQTPAAVQTPAVVPQISPSIQNAPSPTAGVPSRPSPVQEGRVRTPRQPGAEVPLAQPRQEGGAGPTYARGVHVERPANGRAPEPVRAAPPQVKPQPAEVQIRERPEQRNHEARRDGRERQQAN